jgi:hypothetical protein
MISVFSRLFGYILAYLLKELPPFVGLIFLMNNQQKSFDLFLPMLIA